MKSSGAAITYTATASTTTGGNWLAVTPGNITTPTGVSVSVIPGSLTAGTYTGSITLTPTFASDSGVTVPVSFVVAPEPTLTVAPGTACLQFDEQRLAAPGPEPGHRREQQCRVFVHRGGVHHVGWKLAFGIARQRHYAWKRERVGHPE